MEASGALYKSTDSSSTQTGGNYQIFNCLSLEHVIRTCLSSCHSIFVMADECAYSTNTGLCYLKSQIVTRPSA